MRNKDDDLFSTACDHVRSSGIASNTNLQATFGIGTGRARKLLARMQQVGLIGPPALNGTREIFPDLKPKPKEGKKVAGPGPGDTSYDAALARVREVGKASAGDLTRHLGVTELQGQGIIAAMIEQGVIRGEPDTLGRHDLVDAGPEPDAGDIDALADEEGDGADDDASDLDIEIEGQAEDDGPELHPTDAQEAAAERERERERERREQEPHRVQGVGSNMVSGKELVTYAERIEFIRKEKKGKADLEAEVFAEVKSKGYDVTIFRNLLKRRGQKPSAREEQDAVTDLYAAAMGMASEPPLFRHLTGLGMDPAVRESVIASLSAICPMDSVVIIRGPQVSLQIQRNRDGVTVGEAPEPAPPPKEDKAPEDEAPVIDPTDNIDDHQARDMGMEARKDDVPIVKNPFVFGDPRRQHWDEGWRDEDAR